VSIISSCGLAKVTCVALLAAITSNLLQHAQALLG
jgi:hypothetical protein